MQHRTGSQQSLVAGDVTPLHTHIPWRNNLISEGPAAAVLSFTYGTFLMHPPVLLAEQTEALHKVMHIHTHTHTHQT